MQIYPGLCRKTDWTACTTGTLLAAAVPADFPQLSAATAAAPSLNAQRQPAAAATNARQPPLPRGGSNRLFTTALLRSSSKEALNMRGGTFCHAEMAVREARREAAFERAIVRIQAAYRGRRGRAHAGAVVRSRARLESARRRLRVPTYTSEVGLPLLVACLLWGCVVWGCASFEEGAFPLAAAVPLALLLFGVFGVNGPRRLVATLGIAVLCGGTLVAMLAVRVVGGPLTPGAVTVVSLAWRSLALSVAAFAARFQRTCNPPLAATCEMEHAMLEEVERVGQTGDMLLYSGSDIMGRGIRFFTLSSYSHCAIILR